MAKRSVVVGDRLLTHVIEGRWAGKGHQMNVLFFTDWFSCEALDNPH